ncbi:MAG: M48 family metallopeptidase [Candidatus Hydrogenedentes bacterium]|nr:M48 family metallopeptidase [Candidatus Hydrogenedentota bacterium]
MRPLSPISRSLHRLALASAFFAGLALFLLATPIAQAQSTTSTPSTTSTQSTDPDAPVPVPEPSPLALQYHHSNNYIWLFFQFWGIFLPGIFVFTGLSAKVRDFAQRLGRRWFFVVGIYCVLVLSLQFIVMLPFAYYIGFVRQHAYGLSNQTLFKWASDYVISLGVSCVGGFLLLWIPYGLGKLSPRRWWLYTALLAAPFICFQMLIWPVWIDPLYNSFGAMKDKQLESDILALAQRAGIEGGRVYEVKKSVDTKAVNAYVTGFGATKRIVLWDTAIQKLTRDELLVVMAHEMGHYVLGHVVKMICFSTVLLFFFLYLVHRLGEYLVAHFGRRLKFQQLSDVASLPLIVMLAAALSLVFEPAALAYSRFIEHEADQFGVEITRSNRAAATAFVKIQQENLGVPRHGLLYTIWRSSHPSIGDRIDFFNGYKPWKTGAALRYEHLFKPVKPLDQRTGDGNP